MFAALILLMCGVTLGTVYMSAVYSLYSLLFYALTCIKARRCLALTDIFILQSGFLWYSSCSEGTSGCYLRECYFTVSQCVGICKYNCVCRCLRKLCLIEFDICLITGHVSSPTSLILSRGNKEMEMKTCPLTHMRKHFA